MSTNAESDFIKRCRRGEASAWDELFELHYAATARFIYQLYPDLTHEDTQEICQEVFLSVVKNLASFNGRSRLQTWIFRIAVNKARDYRDRQNAAKRGGGMSPLSLQAEDPDTGLTLDLPASAPSPDQACSRSEFHRQISQALEQLSETHREVIHLRFFGDLSYDEIASALNLNRQTVSSRLSRGLDHLAVILRRTAAREQNAFA